jgi:hypothetical protein
MKLTPGGLGFLKCNTSSPDFTADEFRGIPDEYGGRSLVKRHTYVGSSPTFTSGDDAWIVLIPIPGVAFFYGSNVSDTLLLTPVFYSDTTTLFPVGSETSVVNKFRYASNALEIIPTANAMTWAGSIQVFKGPVEAQVQAVGTSGAYVKLSGLDDLINSVRPDCVHPFNLGAYVPTTTTADDYPFVPVATAQTYSDISPAMTTQSTAGLTCAFATISTQNFIGLGHQEAVFLKIPNWSATANPFTIRTWSCIEYQCGSASALFEYQTLSAPYDPLALAILKKFYADHPSAVPFYENDSFWKRLLEWIRVGSDAVSHIPGEVGMIGKGVNLVANAVSAMTL